MHLRNLTAARAAAAAAAASCLAVPAAAGAMPTDATLRVEAAGTALDRGTTYVTDDARLTTSQAPDCGGSGKEVGVPGATALGLVTSAEVANPRLAPFGVSDRFEFGLTVCSIGRYSGWEKAYWLFRVNHRSPDEGADAVRLRGGDEVLWYFSDTSRNVNTGDELDLSAPARVRPGRRFTVTVVAYDASGARKPAAGARVGGTRTDAMGRARLTLGRSRTTTLRATRGADIPSAPTSVCVGSAGCPPRRGHRVVGTPTDDIVAGTPGADRLEGRAGNDRIRAAGGGRDVVDCGTGRDVAEVDRHDVVRGGCERIIRRS